jgi:hypothetical protein
MQGQQRLNRVLVSLVHENRMLMLSPSVEMGVEREMNPDDLEVKKLLGEGIGS